MSIIIYNKKRIRCATNYVLYQQNIVRLDLTGLAITFVGVHLFRDLIKDSILSIILSLSL